MATTTTQRSANMRCPKIGFFLLTLLTLSMLPLPAQALRVQFCIPACEGTDPDPQPREFGPGNPQKDPATQQTTNSVQLGTFTHTRNGVTFTITGTVGSLQSATLQKITFNPGFSVTANTGSGCTTGSPCRIEVRATSDQFDFPTEKPVGGYPAGVYMLGSFTGPQAAGTGNGDTISSTAEASGAALVTNPDGTQSLAPVNTDVINATPGTDPGNTGASLPHTCTGQETCKFIATSLRKGFSTSLEETVQQRCAGEQSTCHTRLRTRLNLELKTAGNKVTLPKDWVTANVDPDNPEKNPAEELIRTTVASAGSFEVNSLAVGPQHFLMRATLGLGSKGSIDPVNEDVYIKVGPFATTIVANTPGDKFKRLQDGRLFLFNGKVDGLQVNVTFARDRASSTVWDVVAAVYGVRIGDLVPLPPALTPVEIYVGGDSGKDAVPARLFGNPK